MADALVSIALEKLVYVLEQQLALFADASSELERLKDTFQTIQAVLADMGSRPDEERSFQLWLSRVRQVAYDIDNLLEVGLEKDGSSDDDEAGDGYAGNRVRTLTAPYTWLVRTFSRYKVAHDVKKIRKRLDQIAMHKPIRFIGETMSRPMTNLKIIRTNGQIIGRDDDSDAVISWLVSGSSWRQQLQVIAIVGIGGMGKTALAEKIYLDDKVNDHFKCLCWVSVSDDFDLKRLTKEIIEQVEEASTSMSELDSRQNELLEALRGKRFLLVLDDVRNENREMWKRLRQCLSCGAPGS